MNIRIDWASLKETKPHEYATRFVFGGLVASLAGLIAKHYGPITGGLFLAYPAIFSATASLIYSHEKERKAQIGKDGGQRGKNAAALDAFGTAVGSLGLIAFAVSLWKLIPVMPAGGTLSLALASWGLVSFGAYQVRRLWPRRVKVRRCPGKASI